MRNRARSGSGVAIESLEGRRLLSGVVPRHVPVVFPNLVGSYDVTAAYSNGQTQTFSVLIVNELGGRFAGSSPDFANITTTKITGSVTRRGAIHFQMKPVRFPGIFTGQGTVNAADQTITATVRGRVGRMTAQGTFTFVPSAG